MSVESDALSIACQSCSRQTSRENASKYLVMIYHLVLQGESKPIRSCSCAKISWPSQARRTTSLFQLIRKTNLSHTQLTFRAPEKHMLQMFSDKIKKTDVHTKLLPEISNLLHEIPSLTASVLLTMLLKRQEVWHSTKLRQLFICFESCRNPP